MAVNYPIVTIFVIYLLIIVGIGFLASLWIKNISDYILAGRNLSSALTALGAGASDMSGWLLMALPGAAYLNGMNQIWMPIGLTLGAYLNWQFVAKRLRIYTEAAQNALTIPSFLDNRFHDRSRLLRKATALVILIFFTAYAAAGFVAGAVLTQHIFHVDYYVALIITATIIILYTCIGGFVAVSWVDFFQGTLMFFALLIVPCVTYYKLNNSEHFIAFYQTLSPNFFDAFHGVETIGIISLLAWGLGYFGQPHIICRFMAARSSREIPAARLICMTWMTLALYGAIFTGILGAAFYNQKIIEIANPETIFLSLAEQLFNPWIAGILIAAVLSAIMSTVSAQLLAAGSAITEDLFPNAIWTEAKKVLIARIAVLMVAFIAVAISANGATSKTILELVAYAWSGIGAAFGPVILMSLYWRRMTRNAAISGMLIGALTVILWEFCGARYHGIFMLYSIAPAFFLNLITIVLVSLYEAPPHKAILDVFDRVKAAQHI